MRCGRFCGNRPWGNRRYLSNHQSNHRYNRSQNEYQTKVKNWQQTDILIEVGEEVSVATLAVEKVKTEITVKNKDILTDIISPDTHVNFIVKMLV